MRMTCKIIQNYSELHWFLLPILQPTFGDHGPTIEKAKAFHQNHLIFLILNDDVMSILRISFILLVSIILLQSTSAISNSQGSSEKVRDGECSR